MSTGPCELREASPDGLVWFSCRRLGFYGFRVLRESLLGPHSPPWGERPRFRLQRPAVYAGGVACLVLLVRKVSLLVTMADRSRIKSVLLWEILLAI